MSEPTTEPDGLKAKQKKKQTPLEAFVEMVEELEQLAIKSKKQENGLLVTDGFEYHVFVVPKSTHPEMPNEEDADGEAEEATGPQSQND